MRDGKGIFFRTLNLDKYDRKLISWYRKIKPQIIDDSITVEDYIDRENIKRRN